MSAIHGGGIGLHHVDRDAAASASQPAPGGLLADLASGKGKQKMHHVDRTSLTKAIEPAGITGGIAAALAKRRAVLDDNVDDDDDDGGDSDSWDSD